jgi:hypothetical protein
MRSGFLLVLSGLVLVSAAAVATGCSEDPLNSGSQTLNMTYTPSPSGSGRFDTAAFDINLILALPADPEEAALYGTERLRLRFTPFPANLTLVAPVTYSNIALSAGTYNVTSLQVTAPALVDDNIAPPPYAECIDAREVINRSSAPGVPAAFIFTSPQDDLSALTFTVHPGQTSLALTIDVPGLIEGYENAFTCQLQPCPGCPIDPRAVLTAFNTPAFRAALLANISIR